VVNQLKGDINMTNFVRRQSDNVVEFINGTGNFTAIDENFSTIDEATPEWGLPSGGWDTRYMDCISVEIEVPEGFVTGVSKLVGTEGNYSIELS
jgi:hypothetical protein